MKNEKVSLSLNRLSIDEKLNLATDIVTAMTGNSRFTTPNPTLSAVTNAANNLRNAHLQVLAGDTSKMDLRNANEAILISLLLQLGNYVEGVANAAALSGGDAKSIITSAGMQYRKDKTQAPIPDAPTNLKAKTTTNEGEIELVWDSMPYAHVYVVEYSTDSSVVGARSAGTVSPTPIVTNPTFNAVFTQLTICTRHKFVATGLVGGTKYAFRVYCVGSHGNSPYSTIVVAKAL